MDEPSRSKRGEAREFWEAAIRLCQENCKVDLAKPAGGLVRRNGDREVVHLEPDTPMNMG